VLLSEEDWRAIQEMFHLLSIPGMGKSIRKGMQNINVDTEVFAELEKRAIPFEDHSPNDVLRRVRGRSATGPARSLSVSV
jgi:hypothetical protein